MTDLDAILARGGPWQRAERIGGQLLLQGDCREVMAALPKVCAVLTDPPYGIGRDGQKKTTGGNGGRKAYDFKGWDGYRPMPEVFAAIREISAEQIIWGGNYFADLLPPSMRWLVWDKGQRINQSDGELAWTSQQSALRITEKNRVALMMDGAQHPTQKPIALMEWCLGFLPNARTILDPFMGSGTTLVACQRLGRQGIGIELDAGYFDIACRRVDEAARQPALFHPEPPPKPTQEALL
jgi:site-specific DNA-methyltransferase (adenine-specific)